MVTICYSCAALVLLTVLCVPSVYSYSAGAREESCYNMEAAHVDSISGNNTPSNDCFQFGACQFSLELIAQVNSDDRTVIDDGTITTYECGQVYEVFVNTSQNQFEGYMLEARATTASGGFEEHSTIWGEWQVEQGVSTYHTVDCNRSNDSTETVVGAAATQNTGGQVLNVTLYWRAPPQPENYSDYQNLPENITLWVTIVQAELTYFFPISGPDLARNCTEPPRPSTSVPTPTTSTSVPPTTSLSPPVTSSQLPPPTSLTTSVPTMSPSNVPRDEEENDDEEIIIIAASVGGGGFLLVILLPLLIFIGVCCCCFCGKEKQQPEAVEMKTV